MSEPRQPGRGRDKTPAREETDDLGRQAAADETTQADQGMAGGTGAAPEEGERQPLGTKPFADDDSADQDRG